PNTDPLPGGSCSGSSPSPDLASLTLHAFQLRSQHRHALHPIEAALQYHRATTQGHGAQSHATVGFEQAESIYRTNVMSQVILYQSEDGRTKLDVRLENQTVWLSQKQLTELFGKAKGTISEHIKHIFEDGELEEISVVRLFRTTASDGKNYEVAAKTPLIRPADLADV
ncbi:MAG: hypothetical protein ACO3JG_13735, partial [Luteolibacter sp.]